VVRILSGLRGEGVEPTVVLWALARELRVMLSLIAASGRGLAAELQRLRIWSSRKHLYESAVPRLSVTAVRAMLLRAARLDRVIKGVEAGNVWDELLQLTLMLAGVRPLKMVS
jgi:DNA polymerase-3 subunit delta